MFSNIYLKNHEAKFLDEIKKKKRGSSQEKGSGRGRETYVFFLLGLTYEFEFIGYEWTSTTGKKRQFRVQPTKKLGCMVQITIRDLTVYPEYTILPSCKSKHEVRINQTEKNNFKVHAHSFQSTSGLLC